MTLEELQQRRSERWEQLLAAARMDAKPATALVRRAGLAAWQALPGIALGSLHSLAAGGISPQRLQEELEALLTAKELFELQLWPAPIYTSRELLPVIYVWAGPSPHASRQRSPLAGQIETELLQHDALTTAELRRKLGFARTSEAAIEKACHELARMLRVTRIGSQQGGARWQNLRRACPGVNTETAGISRTTALSELLLPIFEQWQAATAEEQERLLQPRAPAHVLRSVLNGLELGRRLRPISIAGTPGWEWVEEEVKDEDQAAMN